jgi:hypothetical protein
MSAAVRAETPTVDVEQAFAELLNADPDLIEAEFEAIIAANGLEDEPPAPAPPERNDAHRWLPEHARYLRFAPTPAVAPAFGAHVPGRQRSPPPALSP